MKFLLCVLVAVVGFKFANSVSVEKDLTLTFREKQSLDKFRDRVKSLLKEDNQKTDIYLIRWLRAKNFNIDDAENMLKENLKWRKENNIDTIHLENFDDMEKDYHATIDTYDLEGRPVGVIDINTWDIRAAVIQGRGQRLLRWLDRLMENITDQVFERQAKGMNVTQWKVLINTDGFNLVTHGCPLCIPVWIQFIQSLENHYAGWMDEMIAIDAPSAVQVILEILRPFLSKSTRDALHIFSPNRTKWMAYLDERISRDERRPLYGGTKPPVVY
ncbi:SEC14-like protein 2 [Orchesella cincta]|uniref:SEC14-like protein 2 n=1 Tax=Orchesella cincta TaxID=48709 RepID=A0A1D2MLN8_ORCCI|nr:SEC14-like protein 2 [Orchesella cincta]